MFRQLFTPIRWVASTPAPHRQVVCVNGRLLPDLSGRSSKEMIQSAPPGAYTSMRTVDQTRIYSFDSHLRRLMRSSLDLLLRDLNSAALASDVPSASQIQALMNGPLQRIFDSDSPDLLQQSLVPAPTHDAQSASSLVVAALRQAVSEFDSIHPSDVPDTELRLTVLMTWSRLLSGLARNPSVSVTDLLDVYCHVAELPAPNPPPIRVLVRGDHGPRATAAIKYSQWVKDLSNKNQAQDAQHFEERLLLNNAGEVLEGESSNFFALVDGDPASGTSLLQTAEEHVLAGTVRQHVLHQFHQVPAADFAGVELEMVPPNIRDLARWKGAFLTSTTRQVLPVDELHIRVSRSALEERRQQPQHTPASSLEHVLADLILAEQADSPGDSSGGVASLAELFEEPSGSSPERRLRLRSPFLRGLVRIFKCHTSLGFSPHDVVRVWRLQNPPLIRTVLPDAVKRTLRHLSDPVFSRA